MMANKPNLNAVANKVFQISAPSEQSARRIVRSIDQVENMEARFLDTVVEEMDSLLQDIAIVNPDEDVLKRINQKKDSILKSMRIENEFAKYSGVKRGILPRIMGTPKMPSNELEQARKKVEEYEEMKRLKKEEEEYGE